VDGPSVRAGDPLFYAASQSLKGEQRDQEQEEERRNCFFCLEGWAFLGSLDHDGEEVYEAICCRRCSGTGQLNG
jgi:hypothetical protein